MSLMDVQHRVREAVKPLVLKDEFKPRRIKLGVARGIVILINRRYNLQLELGLYETELSRIYRRHIRPGSVVYDIGTGNAREALLFARLGAAQILSFDPDPGWAPFVAQNLRLNPELAGRVAYRPEAFTHISPEWPEPSFAKIDVDGAELAVLEAFAGRAGAVVVETHSRALEDECAALLVGQGYRVTVVRNAPWRVLYPEYRPAEQNRWLLAERS